MKEVFDIVIVGAGTGGSIAAITAAKKKIKVCLIDGKNKEKIGDKVCGDIIDVSYFDWLNKIIGLSHPKGEELNTKLNGLKIVAPDNKTSIQIGQEQYMLDRHKFGQRLIQEAIDKGVTLFDGLFIKEPIIKDNTVIGVIAEGTSLHEKREIYGKIIIDASGAIPALRDKVILKNSFLERNISKEDMAIAYREVRNLKTEMSDKKFAYIYFSNKIVPSGYIWYFPDGDHKVNVGLGVKRSFDNPQLKQRFENHILKNPLLEDSQIVKKGGGVLPTRKPLCSLVANGFMCVGDAGCQINPIHGGGIGPSMIGGYLAAVTAIEAINKENVSQEILWNYNQKYMDAYGASQTALDIFRIFFQSCSDDDLNFGIKYLVTEESVRKINKGEKIRLTTVEKTKILIRGFFKLRLLNNFRLILKNMQEIKELSNAYPQPSEFEIWKGKINQVYNNTYKILKEKKQ
jgi:digeranylgeranylglycerophospholipid reductase